MLGVTAARGNVSVCLLSCLTQSCAVPAGMLERAKAEPGLPAAAQRSGAYTGTAAHAGCTEALPARLGCCGAYSAPHARVPSQAAHGSAACGCYLHTGTDLTSSKLYVIFIIRTHWPSHSPVYEDMHNDYAGVCYVSANSKKRVPPIP